MWLNLLFAPRNIDIIKATSKKQIKFLGIHFYEII